MIVGCALSPVETAGDYFAIIHDGKFVVHVIGAKILSHRHTSGRQKADIRTLIPCLLVVSDDSNGDAAFGGASNPQGNPIIGDCEDADV